MHGLETIIKLNEEKASKPSLATYLERELNYAKWDLENNAKDDKGLHRFLKGRVNGLETALSILKDKIFYRRD